MGHLHLLFSPSLDTAASEIETTDVPGYPKRPRLVLLPFML